MLFFLKRQDHQLKVLGCKLTPPAFYFLFFALLFLQYPLKGMLVGNCDSYAVIALSNTYLSQILAWFSGVDIGVSMFPAGNVFAYGEASPGGALLYLLGKIFVRDDIWALYLFCVIIFALNGYGVYRLIHRETKDFLSSLLGGFFFSCSNFMFANIDDSIVIFFAGMCIILEIFLNSIERRNSRGIIVVGVILGLHIYFSVYVFVLSALVTVLVTIIYLKEILKKELLKYIGAAALIAISIATPFWLFYYYSSVNLAMDPISPQGVIAQSSLSFADIFRALPGNLLFSNLVEATREHVEWAFQRRHAFIGFIIMPFVFLGLSRKRSIVLFCIIGLTAFLLALGPRIWIGGEAYYSPLTLFYDHIGLMRYFRVPVRAFFLTTLVLSILGGIGIFSLQTRIPLIRKCLILLAVIYFFEQVPLPIKGFHARKFLTIPDGYQSFFKDRRGELIVDLPSNTGFSTFKSQVDLFDYNREFIYMYFQTIHKQNIINGVNGYLPFSRIVIQKYINLLPQEHAIAYLADQGVNFLVFHKKKVLIRDLSLGNKLSQSPYLKTEHDDEDITIYSILRPIL